MDDIARLDTVFLQNSHVIGMEIKFQVETARISEEGKKRILGGRDRIDDVTGCRMFNLFNDISRLNVYYVPPGILPEAAGTQALAVTLRWLLGVRAQFVPIDAGANDRGRILAHEMGHLFGLAHVTDPEVFPKNVMYWGEWLTQAQGDAIFRHIVSSSSKGKYLPKGLFC